MYRLESFDVPLVTNTLDAPLKATLDITALNKELTSLIKKEVNEQDFFYSRETGGTVVSSALELMHQIIFDRLRSLTFSTFY